MDQYVSTIIITVITGIFSIITLLIQKKQDNVISKIDEQTSFIEKEKVVKQKLNKKEKEKELLIHEIMLLILNTNLDILKDMGHAEERPDVFTVSDDLNKKFETLSNEIGELNKEYEMILDITSELHKNINTKL